VAKVRLSRKTPIYADGVVLNGVRDFDVDLDLDSVDVTPWYGDARGELTLTEGNTITLLVWYPEDVTRFIQKWNKFPPQPISISVDGASANFLVHKIKLAGQFTGLQSYEITLKLWPY
jgi:hypothetical protein